MMTLKIDRILNKFKICMMYDIKITNLLSFLLNISIKIKYINKFTQLDYK